MDEWVYLLIFFTNLICIDTQQQEESLLCIKQPQANICQPKRRRYDITNLGLDDYYYGWADVQGQGAANDYCRIVGTASNTWLACALAGTHGESDTNYESDKSNFEAGYTLTWYMKDEDGDGRDDYCRCVGDDSRGYEIICTKAGRLGFYGSKAQGGNTYTFSLTGPISCKNRYVRPEFGRVYRVPT